VNVEKAKVGTMPQRLLDRATRVDCLGDHVETAFFQRQTNAETCGSMVVGEHYAKRLPYGRSTSTTVPAPWLEAMLRLPPSISARSRMLTRPRPLPALIALPTSNPEPSSAMLSEGFDGPPRKRTRIRRAVPWRIALIDASCRMRSRALRHSASTITLRSSSR